MGYMYILFKTVYRLIYSHLNVKWLKRFGYTNTLSRLTVSTFKKSDDMFVLGSGASILDIEPATWENIARSNSIGINFWLIHDFIPNVLMFEMPRDERKHNFLSLLEAKKEDYKDVPLVYKGHYKNRKDYGEVKHITQTLPLNLHTSLYLPYEFSLAGRNRSEFRASLELLYKIGFFNTRDNMSTLCQYRGSITCAIVFALKAGFKRVVLAGVDLNNIKYFYDENRTYYEAKGLDVPSTGQVGVEHKTNTTLSGGIRIEEAIVELDLFARKYLNARICVLGQHSALSDKLDRYEA
jgi:hypothetical protein